MLKTLHIKNPSPKLLEFVRKLQSEKEEKLRSFRESKAEKNKAK